MIVMMILASSGLYVLTVWLLLHVNVRLERQVIALILSVGHRKLCFYTINTK